MLLEWICCTYGIFMSPFSSPRWRRFSTISLPCFLCSASVWTSIYIVNNSKHTFLGWNSDTDILLSKPHSLFGCQCYSMIQLLSKGCCAVHLLSLEDCQGSCRCCQRIAHLSTALWQSPEKSQHLHIKNGEWLLKAFVINGVFLCMHGW